jgi:hypothetical protein
MWFCETRASIVPGTRGRRRHSGPRQRRPGAAAPGWSGVQPKATNRGARDPVNPRRAPRDGTGWLAQSGVLGDDLQHMAGYGVVSEQFDGQLHDFVVAGAEAGCFYVEDRGGPDESRRPLHCIFKASKDTVRLLPLPLARSTKDQRSSIPAANACRKRPTSWSNPRTRL